jgi:hypothetical protein
MGDVAAGAFDGWAGQLVSASLGGLLGIAAALVAIWLTRRADRLKSLQESALRSAEKIVESLAQFIRTWEDTPLRPPEKWYERIDDAHVDTYLTMQVHGPVIPNGALQDYLGEYHKFITGVLQEWKGFVEFTFQRSPGTTAADVKWPTDFEVNLKKLDALLKGASFEAFDSMNIWRTKLSFDRSQITKINPELLTRVHRALYNGG